MEIEEAIEERIDLKENEEGSADPMIEKKAADAAEMDAEKKAEAKRFEKMIEAIVAELKKMDFQ